MERGNHFGDFMLFSNIAILLKSINYIVFN